MMCKVAGDGRALMVAILKSPQMEPAGFYDPTYLFPKLFGSNSGLDCDSTNKCK